MTILSRKEAAKFLKISVRKLTRMMENDEVPFVMIGRRAHFVKEQLINWIESGGSDGKAIFPA